FKEIIVRVPFEVSSLPFKELYWQKKYFKVIVDILIPYFTKLVNIIWHIQELFLCGLANELKSAIGGNTILHLHILPWKFTFERNEQLFNRLYSDFLIEKYDSISKNTIEKIAYKLSDKIICVSHSAKQYITSVFKIEPEKIVVIFNGLMNFNTGILHSYEKESGYYSLWNMG
ncbi:glycosyltransferase family 4 protein, partial [Bacteroides acidifaciens]